MVELYAPHNGSVSPAKETDCSQFINNRTQCTLPPRFDDVVAIAWRQMGGRTLEKAWVSARARTRLTAPLHE